MLLVLRARAVGTVADFCATAGSKKDCRKKGPPTYYKGLSRGWVAEDWNTEKGNFRRFCRWAKRDSACVPKKKNKK